jgi:hypothetical protein
MGCQIRGVQLVGDDSHFVLPEPAVASGQLSGSWGQIWLQQGACPILSSEPVGMSHNQFSPPQQCNEWSDVDPDGHALEFMQQFQELCSLWVSLFVGHCQLMCDRF